MPVFTKKSSSNRRNIEDFPEFAEASETLRRLQVEEQKLVDEGRRLSSTTPRTAPSIIDRLAAAFTATAKGETVEPVEAANGPTLADRRAAAHQAVEQQQAVIEQLRRRLAPELYKANYEADHFAARQRIATAIVELKKAVDDEQALTNQMFAAGALTDPTFGHRLWVNVSNCTRLPQVIREMSLSSFIECNKNLLK